MKKNRILLVAPILLTVLLAALAPIGIALAATGLLLGACTIAPLLADDPALRRDAGISLERRTEPRS